MSDSTLKLVPVDVMILPSKAENERPIRNNGLKNDVIEVSYREVNDGAAKTKVKDMKESLAKTSDVEEKAITATNKEEILDKIEKGEVVAAGDIKNPINIAASIVLAGLSIYVTGKNAGALFSKVFKGAPAAMENGLKGASKFIEKRAKSLTTVTPGKLNKAKDIAGKILYKTEELAKKGYKRIAYAGIPKNINASERTTEAFKNVSGAGAVALMVPRILKRDSNEDGVSDIMQKTQNAYTGTKRDIGSALENATVISEVISALT